MSKLTFITNIVANEDEIELVKAERLKLIYITRAEEGCIKTTFTKIMKIQHISCFTRTGYLVNYGKLI